MKKLLALLLSIITLLMVVVAACGSEAPTPTQAPSATQTPNATQAPSAVQTPAATQQPQEGAQGSDDETQTSSILIAYFTRLDNTDATLDEIVQGGGPYGSLGESFENADADAITSASITLLNEEVQGNVQTMAQMIAAVTGGELFSIQTVQKYPADYDDLIDLGGDEKNASARPELSSHVENMEDYDVIFLGYPNWWYDMPMAIYSFLEEYDLSGKTIIPFAASAGSGFSNTIATIGQLQPEASVVENGLHIHMRDVADGQARIEEWISALDILGE